MTSVSFLSVLFFRTLFSSIYVSHCFFIFFTKVDIPTFSWSKKPTIQCGYALINRQLWGVSFSNHSDGLNE